MAKSEHVSGMQITVFGASGKVGRRVVDLALERGYDVVAFVHSRDPFTKSPNLIVKKGDIYNQKDVEAAIVGSGAVISCLGSWGTKRRDVLTSAMRHIIPAMQKHKVYRIITLTGAGAYAPDESPKISHKLFMKLLSPTPAGKVFADGEAHMKLLAESKLGWTTIRSPIMDNNPDAAYQMDMVRDFILETISRGAVANCMLDELRYTDYLRAAPIIHPDK